MILRLVTSCAILLCLLLAPTPSAWGQGTATAEIKIAVTQAGVVRLTGDELIQANASFAGVPVDLIHLHSDGTPLPLLIQNTSGTLSSADQLLFAATSPNGDDEAWAYEGFKPPTGAGTLYADTAYYWVSLRDVAGLRYTSGSAGATAGALLLNTRRFEQDNTYFAGATANSGNPLYTQGEGYYDVRLSGGQTIERIVTPERLLGDSSRVVVRLVGGSGSSHGTTVEVSARSGASTWVEMGSAEVTWSGYEARLVAVGGSAPEASEIRVRIRISAPVTSPDYTYLDYIEVQNFDRGSVASGLSGEVISLEAGSMQVPTASVVLIPNALRASNLATGARIDVQVGEQVFVSPTNEFVTPSRIADYNRPAIAEPTGGVDYVLITRPALRTSAEAYASYRRTSGYRVLVVDQQDLFDQFDGGRQRPIAIRRFLYATQAWTTPPRYVLFWGDALLPFKGKSLEPWEVISFGNSVSDGWYGMQFNGPTDWSEIAAIGRVPVRSNAEGDQFLAKMQRYESSPPARWPKRGLFVSGGYSAGEVSTLASYSSAWATTSATGQARLDTTQIVKRNLEKVDARYLKPIERQINEGIGWFSFFGHSSPQTWEIETAPAASYANPVQLPLILSFGCRTGAFALGDSSTHTLSLAEEFVIGAETGAIAHWGSSELSTISAGGYLGNQVHNLVMTDTMRVLGEVFRTAKTRLAAFTTGGSNAKNLLQYGLIGDPATRLQLPTRPNLVLAERAIRVSPERPSLSDSVLTLNARLDNWGLSFSDSLSVRVRHFTPEGLARTEIRRVGPYADSTNARFLLPLTGLKAGAHSVEVSIDSEDTIAESTETDNTTTFSFVVSTRTLASSTLSNDVFYGRPPVLSVTRPTSAPDTGRVAFQVDTTRTFSSSLLQSATRGLMRIAQFEPQQLRPDQQYFWRFRDETDAFSPWIEQSFRFAPSLGRVGWVQTRPTVTEGENNALRSGEVLLSTYNTFVSMASERGGGALLGSIAVGDQSFVTLTLGWGFVVIDGVTGEVKYAASLPTFNMSASLEDRFQTNKALATARLDSLARGLTPGGLNRGDIILGRTRHLGNSDGPIIGDDVKASIRALGSVAIDTLTYSNHLWQMVTRVGYPDQTRERVVRRTADSPSEIKWDTTLVFRNRSAIFTSEPISGALAWLEGGAEGSLPANVSATVDVLGSDGTTVLASAPLGNSLDLSAIDAQVQQQLRLRMRVMDERAYEPITPDTPFAAGTLAAWHLGYEPVPRVALDAVTTTQIDIAEGEIARFSVPVQNLSLSDARDVRLELFLSEPGRTERLLRTDTLGTLPAGAALTREIEVATNGLTGTNQLRFRLRHLDEASSPDDGLSDYALTFHVQGDATAPRYVITIDGDEFEPDDEPIANLQDPAFPFVSARPTIEIQVRDDNRFRALTDASVIQLSLNGKPISISDPDVRFTPGDTLAGLVYTPDLTRSDSTYTLVLRAFDASGNEAARSPYQVHFRVQTELEIESVLPYPNPMTDATTFAFRVKGADASEVEEARLRVYTLTGQVVREFDLTGSGPDALDAGMLRIGWNKLRWDGTDADGDRLSPGVYLYRVFLRGAEGSLGQTQVERIAIVR